MFIPCPTSIPDSRVNTQSCIRRPLCSTFKIKILSNVHSEKKNTKRSSTLWAYFEAKKRENNLKNKIHKRDVMQLFSAFAASYKTALFFSKSEKIAAVYTSEWFVIQETFLSLKIRNL